MTGVKYHHQYLSKRLKVGNLRRNRLKIRISPREIFSIKRVRNESVEGKKIISKIYNLRKQVYGVLKWIINPNNPHLIKDEFDDNPNTTHYALMENDKIIGAHRMTKYSKEYSLPFLVGGLNPDIFNIKYINTSEATRLLLKQDKKYPGAAKQLLFNTTKYELEKNAKYILSIGFSQHLDFFQYMGYLPVNKEMNCLLDQYQGKKVFRKGTPILATQSSLNKKIDLFNYNIKRQFTVIENG